ncbi:MAG TPA: hypothetical protein VHW24_08325 [Bryobacteraceae bacterium]|nr:hypothetical protein [Bryobacteraceae bacterium]
MGCQTCQITSETKAKVPRDRLRKKLGIGEKVKLTFSLGSANWYFVYPTDVGLPPSKSPGDARPSDYAISIPDVTVPTWGGLSNDSGSHTEYTAPAIAPNSAVTIAATGSGCTATITFEIVEPQYIKIKNADGSDGYSTHERLKQSTGFLGEIYCFPEDVSFENCWFKEKETCARPSGDWVRLLTVNGKLSCLPHRASTEARRIKRPEDDQSGSPADGLDHISFTNPDRYLINGKDLPTGTLHFAIPFEFSLSETGVFHVPKNFKWAEQLITTNKSGFAQVDKEGGTMKNDLNDDTPPTNSSLKPSNRFGS